MRHSTRSVALGCAGVVATLVVVGCGDLTFGNDGSPPQGTGEVDDDDDGPSDADCCSAHDDPACGNPIVSACVCKEDPACCEQGWDAQCAEKVTSLGCGLCGSPGSCCDATGMPGCTNPAVQNCVCSVDPYCCADGWDEQCVADVFLFECGVCQGASPCCVADGSPGCADVSVQQCVCAQNEHCCVEGWDFQCVQQVSELGCGACEATTSSTTERADTTSTEGDGTQGSASSSSTSSAAAPPRRE